MPDAHDHALSSPSPLATTSKAAQPDDRRTIAASSLQEPSSLQTISTTLTALSRQASSGITSLSSAASRDALSFARTFQKSSGTEAAPPQRGASPSPIFEAMGGNADPTLAEHEVYGKQFAGLEDILATEQAITWTGWDKLPSHGSTPDKDALLIAYAGGGLQIYFKDHDVLVEYLNFQQLILSGDRPAGRILSACIQDHTAAEPRLVIVTASTDQPNLVVSRYSFTSQMVEKSLTLPLPLHLPAWTPLELQSRTASMRHSDRYLVVGQSHPPSLHAIDAKSLTLLRPSVYDVATSSQREARPPAFDLKGNLMAYASTQSLFESNVISHTSHRSEREGPSKGKDRRTKSDASHRKFTPGQDFSMNVDAMMTSAIEVGAQANDAAKRIGTGVLDGVRNLSEWGSAYINTAHLARSLPSDHGSPSLSGSAGQQTSPSLLSACSPLGSPSVAGDVKTGRKVSFGQDDRAKHVERPAGPLATTAKLVDLGSQSSTGEIAVFSTGIHSVACIRISPCSTNVFVADILGHAFNIFELRPAPPCLRGPSQQLPPALHSLKLLRGVTLAQVVDAQWSLNRRWLAVLTQTGTVHTYRLGGTHEAKILPGGSTITSFARTPRPRILQADAPGNASGQASNPIEGFQTPQIPAQPAFIFSNLSSEGSANNLPGFGVLCLHPAIAALTLCRIGLPSSSLTSTLSATAESASGRVSGLTAMMRRATTSAPGGSAPSQMTARPASQTSNSRRTVGECKPIAIWGGLARTHDAPDIRPPGLFLASSPSQRATPARGWVSLAEIATYDRRPRALSNSIYLSHQFAFRRFAHALKGPTIKSLEIPSAPSARLVTREAVHVIQGRAPSVSGGDEPSSMGSFNASLQSAMAAEGYEDDVFMERSPSSRLPSFPQGQAARRPNWRTSVASSVGIPIRVGAAASRDLTRGVMGSMLRPAAPCSYQSGRSAVSFDDDVSYDAHIFADARNAQPSPNGGTSWQSKSPHSHFRAGSSPYGRMVTDGTGSGSGGESNDTPTTALSDGSDDYHDEDGTWAAAKGLQVDVEGDTEGWDSLRDPDSIQRNVHAGLCMDNSNARGDDFVVGGLVLEEESATVASPSSRAIDLLAASQVQLPGSFSRKPTPAISALSAEGSKEGESLTPSSYGSSGSTSEKVKHTTTTASANDTPTSGSSMSGTGRGTSPSPALLASGGASARPPSAASTNSAKSKKGKRK